MTHGGSVREELVLRMRLCKRAADQDYGLASERMTLDQVMEYRRRRAEAEKARSLAASPIKAYIAGAKSKRGLVGELFGMADQ